MGLGHWLGKKVGWSRDINLEEKIVILKEIRDLMGKVDWYLKKRYTRKIDMMVEKDLYRALDRIAQPNELIYFKELARTSKEKISLLKRNVQKEERYRLRRLISLINSMYSSKEKKIEFYETRAKEIIKQIDNHIRYDYST